MDQEFRLATLEEKEIVKQLLMEYSRELYKYERVPSSKFASAQCFDDYWIEHKRFPFIAIQKENVAGICLLRDTCESYSIDEFYIKTKYRRIGLGRKFVQFIVDFCRKDEKHKEIYANSLVDNLLAKWFWNSAGFRTKEIQEAGKERFFINIKKIN
ncbi:MAG: GNAT family N-acetyltransferase [Asgard group archaeon]|nr:GNAT family N-acetyltransferase [Asgard group archaeon]